jgi:hypothetical protein
VAATQTVQVQGEEFPTLDEAIQDVRWRDQVGGDGGRTGWVKLLAANALDGEYAYEIAESF